MFYYRLQYYHLNSDSSSSHNAASHQKNRRQMHLQSWTFISQKLPHLIIFSQYHTILWCIEGTLSRVYPTSTDDPRLYFFQGRGCQKYSNFWLGYLLANFLPTITIYFQSFCSYFRYARKHYTKRTVNCSP